MAFLDGICCDLQLRSVSRGATSYVSFFLIRLTLCFGSERAKPMSRKAANTAMVPVERRQAQSNDSASSIVSATDSAQVLALSDKDFRQRQEMINRHHNRAIQVNSAANYVLAMRFKQLDNSFQHIAGEIDGLKDTMKGQDVHVKGLVKSVGGIQEEMRQQNEKMAELEQEVRFTRVVVVAYHCISHFLNDCGCAYGSCPFYPSVPFPRVGEKTNVCSRGKDPALRIFVSTASSRATITRRAAAGIGKIQDVSGLHCRRTLGRRCGRSCTVAPSSAACGGPCVVRGCTTVAKRLAGCHSSNFEEADSYCAAVSDELAFPCLAQKSG